MPHLNSKRAYDVAIAGAGPAGSSAALVLAAHGLKVAVFEKADLPRYKPCGGGIVARALRHLPPDVDHVLERRCHVARLNLVREGLSFITKRDEPIVSMTMRGEFDFALISKAAKQGAHILTRCKVLDISSSAEHVEIVTSNGLYRALFLVAADGAAGTVARKAGFRPSRFLAPTLEAEVQTSNETLRKYKNTARFDFGLFPKGYGWVFPKARHLSVGVGCFYLMRMDLNSSLKQYLRRLGLGATKDLQKHGFVIPLAPRKDGFVQNRTILTGDAAGLADPLTGEGITSAVLSGQMAARALIHSELDKDGTKAAYESELEQEVLSELKWGRRIAGFAYGCPRLNGWLLRVYGQQMSEAMTDVFMGSRSYREIMCDPKTYLNLLTPKASERGIKHC